MEEQLCGWLRVCIVFGIYMRPPNDRVGDINGKASIRSTRQLLPPQQLYICLIALTLCALYIHGLCWCGSLPTLQLTWVASLILFSFQVLTNFLILMETVWRHRQHAAFLQLLAQIEVALKLRLRQCTHSAALQRNLCYIIVRLVVFSLVTLILFMITSIWLNYIGFFWNGLWSILTMRIRVIQLLLYVRMLQHYLECLCVKLQQVVEFHVSPQRQLLDIDYSRLTTVEYLLAIKEVYTLIHDAFQLLNYCAGWSLFGIVVCFMFDVSCNVYWTVLSLDNWQNRRYYYIAGPVALLPLLVIICYLCVLCGKCKELGRRIIYLLSSIKVLNSSQSAALYRQVLHDFSVQLHQQQIEVTAQNFFVLELRLLRILFFVTATNFVILLQFLILEIEMVGLTEPN